MSEEREARLHSERLYRDRQRDRGYVRTRVWLPKELKAWHHEVILRARDAKERGIKFKVPKAPDVPHDPSPPLDQETS